MDYTKFLKSKIDIAPKSGFILPADEIHKNLKPHQRAAVLWALEGGKRALFESFGLGKTAQELEFCKHVTKREGGRALITLPLGVRQEFVRDAGDILGLNAPEYVTSMKDICAARGDILITNVERVRDGDIDPAYFCATSIDEAAILRDYGSDTFQTFLPLFKKVPFKLLATAVPAPNRTKELIHYAGYLDVMDTGQALTRWFQRNSTQANDLTLYEGKEEEFWLWVSSWALFIDKPSDLGYSDEGYDLPPLKINYHKLSPPQKTPEIEKNGQVRLFRDAAAGLQEGAREKRESIDIRIEKAVEIVNSDPDAHFILWHDLEAERAEIKQQLPQAVDIYGSMAYDERERRVIDFSDGRTRLFATKKSLSGQGCNFQRYCHREIFVGIDYKFHDFIQAVHRIYRFLQTEQVEIDIIYTEAEQEILDDLLAKWKQYDDMKSRMTEIIRKYGLSNAEVVKRLERKMGVERVEVHGERFTAILNDCVDETARMQENSVDMILTSIPFSNHYEYSANYADFGHNEDTDKFFKQMDFLSPNLLRILRPGRIAAIHVKDRVLFGNATGTGMPTIEPFHAICIAHYMRHGFQYIGMITVVTDVVRENNQTYRLGWSEQCKDGTKMGVGCPEYILLFRKLPSDTSKAYADDPVSKTKEDYTRAQWQIDAHAYWRSSGNRLLSKDELKAYPVDKLQAAYRQFSRAAVYDYDDHVALAKHLDENGKLPATFMVVSPGSWTDEVWDDINRMRTLNTQQSQKRRQMHVCPLQIDTVDRLINRYTNEGEEICDPFAGIFTVPYRAIKLNRRGRGIELNADYFRDGVGYCREAEAERIAPTLFDLEAL